MSGLSPTTTNQLNEVAPARLAAELRHLPGLIFLDSSSSDAPGSESPAGRYSLIAARPLRVFRGNLFDESSLAPLRARIAGRRCSTRPDLGRPGPGFYGTVDYEGGFHFGEYPECLLHDHRSGRWFESGTLSAERRAFVESDLPLPGLGFTDRLDRAAFCQLIEKARDYIAAGDIYQVNLSHRFVAPLPADCDLFQLHLRLREISPAPFACYAELGARTILSSSPEEFLRMSGRHIRTRPIKGTRPRYRDRERDERSAYDLITSSKEIAELVMITDLERNDLGQVCEFGSVAATELLKLERFAQVFHLVSTVEGTLRADVDQLEALRACFPGGSITGAPKKRAREIIAELEPEPRGLYTGAIGGFGFHGESLFNIAIRTLVAEAGELHFHVGAGIVADSIPAKEWEETLHKAAGMLQASGFL